MSVWTSYTEQCLERPLTDTDLIWQVSGYAQSKWVSERIVQLAINNGLPASIYRSG